VGRIHHTVGGAKLLVGGGESDIAGCESKRSGINGFVKSTSRVSKRLHGTGDSPRELFWDSKMKHRNRTRKREESLAELMEDVE